MITKTGLYYLVGLIMKVIRLVCYSFTLIKVQPKNSLKNVALFPLENI